MSDLSTLYRRGYLATPVVEACQRRGLFQLLDARQSRDRASLIRELGAKAGPFTIALEALQSVGWIESDGEDRYRLAAPHAVRDLTPLYGVAPAELLGREPYARMLAGEIEQVFLNDMRHTEDPARGAIVVPLAVAFHGLGARALRERLENVDPRLAAAIVELFTRQGWLDANASALTLAGRELLESTSLYAAAAFRSPLFAVEAMLFGDVPAGEPRMPIGNNRNNALAVLADAQPAHYTTRDGELVDALAVLTSWQEFLRTQSQLSIETNHDGEWIHRLALDYPITADAFVTVAAGVGLFNDGDVERSPRTSEPCRISGHRFVQRDYIVRHATEADVDRLWELEELCWQHTRTSKERIGERVRRHPLGHLVLEKNGEVLGVVYSQRITDRAALLARTAANVDELHDPAGPIVQLLALNVDPRVQNLNYGDQLLELMLQRCTLMTGVTTVVGVTLCKSYDAARGVAFDDYIRVEGSGQDPVLAFHQAHGARVVQAVPGYRPEDATNLHHGVLVAYEEIFNRTSRHRAAAAPARTASFERRQIAHTLRTEVARLLGIDANDVDVERPVMEMGLDSADLLKLQRHCETAFGIELEAGFFFEYSTLARVVEHLAGLLAPAEETSVARPAIESVESIDVVPEANWAPGDVAIVGMSCKLPGGIDTPGQLWDVLAAERCVIGTYPQERGSWPAAADHPAIDRGGFVADADAFDAAFFRMSPAEAQITDPQQRMLMELAWACLEDGGILPASLKGSKTGVFVGASNCDYSRLLQDAGVAVEGHHGVGSSLAILSNRISYFFDLSGPSLTIDTACSSSLVALHTAIQSLRSGQCPAAIVGGVNLICHPDLSIAYHKAGMLAADGLCKVFDATADGYVRSEGAVVLFLKPVHAAIADGNQIHAVIRGSAINHGGLAGGLTVPNPQKQSELLQAAWSDAGISARDLTYLEAHGTGTSLGDPIEIQGILHAASANTDAHCAIGSVKSNLGHLESAAGITGLLKIVLSLRHRQLPASVNFSELNPKIRLSGTPFAIQSRLEHWNADRPRIAGVSSFGSGGANGHLVVQEYPRTQSVVMPRRESLFVLSAATPDALRTSAVRAMEWLEREGSDANFAAAMFTWQTGRTAMKHRLAVKAAHRAELLEKLRRWVAGTNGIASLWIGQAGLNDGQLAWGTASGRRLIEQALADNDLELLGGVWTSGTDVDWNRLWTGGVRPEPISVPTYPFAREHYWIEAAPRAVTTAQSVLHPLLHVNTSDLREQRYTSVFGGSEFFLADHQIRLDGRDAQKVLPGVAYLEMARAAVQHAVAGSAIELRNTVWVQPIVVDEQKEVRIALFADDESDVDFEIACGDDIHCEGRAITVAASTTPRLDLAALEQQIGGTRIEAGEAYAAFARLGLQYGPAFRGITALRRGDSQVLAQLRLPDPVAHGAGDYVLHPSILDGALQAAVHLIGGADGQPPLPFALESLRVFAPCTRDMHAWVRPAQGSGAGDGIVKLDIDLCDADGNVCVQLHGFSSRVTTRAATVLAAPVWESAAIDAGKFDYAERHVVVCEPEPGKSIAERYSDCALQCFERVQSILAEKSQAKVLLQVVVQGDGEQEVLAGLSGLLRSAALENPRFAGQVILAASALSADHLEQEATAAPEPLVRYSGEGRQVLRWQEVAAQDGAPAIAFKENGVYLITGGTGSLGRIFARDIVASAANAHVVLSGRAALSGDTTLGERVTYRQADLLDQADVTRMVDGIVREYGRLDGVLHCAGMIADDFIVRKTAAQFKDVLAPKVTGTFHLDQATRGMELDFFALFSSIVGATGNVGQADYAAANGFLDQFAAWRQGRMHAIGWPLWREGGMGTDGAAEERLLQTTGTRAIDREAGVQAFRRALRSPHAQTLVLSGDAARIRRALLASGRQAPPPVPTSSTAEITNLPEKTEEYLRRELASLVKLPSHRIDPRAALEEYGIDSILAMKMTTQLEETFGSLAKTLFFEYKTLRELSGYFVAQHAAQLSALFGTEAPRTATPAPAQTEVVVPAPRKRRGGKLRGNAAPAVARDVEPIAIIGLSGRYPQAFNVDQYWQNLRDGKDCIVEVPKERWDWREHYTEDRSKSGRHYSKWGGFIEGVDEFDPLFFNIAPKEANYIDPQERLFLQHAWMAIEDAGYTRAAMQVPSGDDLAGQAGVYVGVMWSEYQTVGAAMSAEELRMGFAGNLASIANRVSYALNLHGPSMTIDTMCSSSLTAIHVACQDLQLGRTTMAIAGGVNVSVHPNKYLLLSVGQFISSDGHCQSFGEGGDGYIPGEGVGAVVLKRLSDAERDGDHIYGVIRGSALTHGGKTNGYTVPNPQAQTSAITRALSEARIDARHVSYIEAHGTGTKLGDPIEIAALSKAFAQHTQESGFCLIGSAKSNVGHCESAAGIAGLTKVLLQMQHRQIVPSLHSAQLNPHIDFTKTPFVVNQSLRDWERPVIDGRTLPRIAGISSFGAGGSNAHMIIEEYAAPVREPRQTADAIVLLSARTADQLRQKAVELYAFVKERASTIDLPSLAYTLQTGREAMDERLAFVVASVAELVERLGAYVAGDEHPEGAYSGSVKRNREALAVFTADADLQQTLDKWIENRKLARLADLWVKGLDVEWIRLYGDEHPQRVSLPVYPFARERYWLDAAPKQQAPAREVAAMLHPLLHANTSDLGEQRFSTTLSSRAQSRDLGAGVEPAIVLAMARAAVAHAAPESKPFELRDVVWGDPIVLNRQVNIALWPGDRDEIHYEIYSENGETIHAQGRAVPNPQPAPARLDLDQLERRGERITRLRAIASDDARHYDIHPDLLDDVIHAAGDGQLASLDALRVVAPCAGDAAAWVRASLDGAIDVDLCDPAGNVVAQLRGMRWQQQASAVVVEAPIVDTVVEKPTPEPAATRREIVLAAATVKKQRAPLALSAPGALIASRPSAAKPAITLTAATPASATPAASDVAVRLFDCGDGLFAIEVAPPHDGGDAQNVIAALLHALDRAQCEASLKVLTLRGVERWLDGQSDTALHAAVAAFPLPVIAILEHDATGAAFLFAALCDFMLCNEAASYGSGASLTPSAAAILRKRFGCAPIAIAKGRELRTRGFSFPVLPAAQLTAYADELAASLLAKSSLALRLLDQHLTRELAVLAAALTRDETAGARPVRVLDDVREITTAGDDALVVKIDSEISGEILPELQRVLAERNAPVIAALPANANGNALLLAQICDAAVYARQGVYSAAGIAETAATWLVHRLGSDAAAEMLLTGGDYSGADLAARTHAIVVDAADVLTTAIELAASLPKRQDDVIVTAAVDAVDDSAETVVAESFALPLRSSVVTATVHPGGIVVVKMEDRAARNMFSDALVAGVREAFALIEATPACKVVVLTGYDTYFSSGGTKESLFAIQNGTAKFTDFDIYEAALHCSLPVIAAVQGHGIGAGWSLAMFADVVLLSEESRYVSPYMNYGFTPGAGATWILPEKLGADLARESLLTAQPYSGRELQARGVRLRVLPRAAVVAAAMELAARIARAPRRRLLALERQLTAHMRAQLADTYARELAMHDQTFVGNAATLATLRERFQEEAEPRVPVQNRQAGAPVFHDKDVAATLRALLALELQVAESDIDESTQFVELGLDSISGVTWIRKINEKYGTSIEATKVYTYPTLAALSRYVKSEAEGRGTLTTTMPAPAPEPAAPHDVAATLRSMLAGELQIRESEIDDRTQFVELGLDSISGVTWIRKINEKYGTSIEATKVYSYPTLAELSRYVETEAQTRGTLASAPAVATPQTAPRPQIAATVPAKRLTSRRRRTRVSHAGAPAAPRTTQAIAVIGMAGQFPQARNLEEYWRNIAAGRNCISEVPRQRWDAATYYRPGEPMPGRTTSQWAGLVEHYDRFDPLFFNTSPTEAEHMDPQQRLFLETCWHSIENAGYAARSLSGSKCGVFVGCANGDYHYASREHQLSAQGFTGSAMSILGARISYFLNLQGACVSIDTACSSSLVALAQACDSLASGGSDMALAGGVYVMTGPEMHIKTSQSGMLSPDGRCFTFDQRANGFVPGEGAGVVLLKRLDDALRDGDNVHAVIRAWGVNQDGKTNGITAPNPESQTRLEQEVYDKFGIDAAAIQLIEAHGTGTKLGDPIEVEGLKNAFRKYTRDTDYCAIGSVKSNIGHCLAAAGIAGVLKLVLALKQRQLPPTIHFERLNEHIDLTGSPFFVNTQLRDWAPRNGARLAATSSFGFSGTNAHVVIGEAPAPPEIARPHVLTQDGQVMVPLSARTREQLRQKARELAQFIRDNAGVDLLSIAYTLQLGREPMDERLGVMASSAAELAAKLDAYLDGQRNIDGLYAGQVRRNVDNTSIISQDDDVKETIVAKWLAARKLAKLLELWAHGLEFDWNRCYGDVKPRRIALPLYPFARERYWIEPAAVATVTKADATVLHPLLQRNTSGLTELTYASTLTGHEFFLADHRVRIDGRTAQKVLPGVAYLEMARAAVAHAWPAQAESSVIELRDVVWIKPVIAGEEREVSIALCVDDDEWIDYEVFTNDGDEETVHCEGQAAFMRRRAPVRLDLAALRRQMTRGRLDASAVYATFEAMGLHYGPAHRGVAAIELGDGQLLAQLRLPAGVDGQPYVLHPSLMDSALQASIGLLADGGNALAHPVVPFAADCVRVLAPCAKELFAWVRYAAGSGRGERMVRFDIDLCDADGVVCVQIEGFASRVLDGETRAILPSGTPKLSIRKLASFDDAFYDQLLDDVMNGEISIDEAVELG